MCLKILYHSAEEMSIKNGENRELCLWFSPFLYTVEAFVVHYLGTLALVDNDELVSKISPCFLQISRLPSSRGISYTQLRRRSEPQRHSSSFFPGERARSRASGGAAAGWLGR